MVFQTNAGKTKTYSGWYSVRKEKAIEWNIKSGGKHPGLNRWVLNCEKYPNKKMQYANIKQMCEEDLGIDVSEILILE